MEINISTNTKEIIEAFTGMNIEEFLEQTKKDLLNQYQEDGNTLTVKEAAKIMGKSEQFVRVGLQRKLLPFGVAINMSNKYSYYISPKQFYTFVGYPIDALSE